MKKYISLLLAALMLLSLLAGCGGGKTNADDGDGTRTLVLRNTAGLSTNDPHATTNTHDYTVFENIYEGLYDLNEATGGYDLRLAEKVEANDDATEYIVTLKQGVKFHNGETMTADDVVFSYDHAQKDAHIVAQTCDNVAVMYAGEIIEMGSAEDIFTRPIHHPYTDGLFGSLPNLKEKTDRLHPIAGLMPDPTNLPKGCKFAPRCDKCMEICKEVPPEVYVDGTHSIRCHLYCQKKED